MAKTYEIQNFGVMEFPDEMSHEQIQWELNTNILPNAGDPDPDMVAQYPDLFPDIDRGSFSQGFGANVEGLSRIDEAVGAAVFRSKEDLESGAAQRAEAAERAKYNVTFEQLGDQWSRGDRTGAASNFFTDYLPQKAGESAVEMGLAAGVGLGVATLPITGPAALAAGVGATALALWPTMFRSFVESQIDEKDITDPNDIETFKAASLSLLAGSMEGLLYPLLGAVPGIKSLAGASASELVKRGATMLSTKEGIRRASAIALASGLEEGTVEVGQSALERYQAGQEISPADQGAMKEYLESFVVGFSLSMPIGSAAGVRSAVQTGRGVQEEREALEQDASAFDQMFNEDRAYRQGAGLYGEETQPLGDVARLTDQSDRGYSPPSFEETDLQAESQEDFDTRVLNAAIGAAAEPANQNEQQRANADRVARAKNRMPTLEYTVDEIAAISPELARKVVDRAPEKETFTYDEVHAAARSNFPGITPVELKEKLHDTHVAKTPVLATANTIQVPDIMQLAKEKKVRTKGRAFSAFVKQVSGANALDETTAYERRLIRDALAELDPAKKPYDPVPVKKLRSGERIDQSKYMAAVAAIKAHPTMQVIPKKIAEAINATHDEVLDIRDALINDGFLKRDGKSGPYRAAQMNKVQRPGKKAEWVDSLADDPMTRTPPPAADAEAVVPSQNTFDVREISPDKDGKPRFVVEANPLPQTTEEAAQGPLVADQPMGREVISFHGTREEAEASAENYRTAPATSTSGDLRGRAADPAAYAEQVNRATATPIRKSDLTDRIKTALNDSMARRGLAAAGVNLEVLDSVFEKLEDAPTNVEGAHDPNAGPKGAIYLGLDAVNPDTPIDTHEQQVLDHLMNVLSHEQIHAFKDLGILNDSDYKLLARYAETHNRPEQFRRAEGKGKAKWTYLDDARVSHKDARNMTEEELVEEAVAEMFRDWGQDKSSVSGKPASLFRRIVKFITSLGGFLREQGARGVQDIFGELDTGAMARERQDATPRGDGEVRSSISPRSAEAQRREDEALADFQRLADKVKETNPDRPGFDLEASRRLHEAREIHGEAINDRLYEQVLAELAGTPYIAKRTSYEESIAPQDKLAQLLGPPTSHRVSIYNQEGDIMRNVTMVADMRNERFRAMARGERVPPAYAGFAPEELQEISDKLRDDARADVPTGEVVSFPSFSIAGPISRDAWEDLYEALDETQHGIMETYAANPTVKQNWRVFPAARLTKIWTDFAERGIIRDTKGLERMAALFQENTLKLQANTILAGHEQTDPQDLWREFLGEEATDAEIEQLDEGFGDHILDDTGQWRISDYGIGKLMDAAARLNDAASPEEQLPLLDMMLNVVHQRSDMAANFVEGGQLPLDRLFAHSPDMPSFSIAPRIFEDGGVDGKFTGYFPAIRQHIHDYMDTGDKASLQKAVQEPGYPAYLKKLHQIVARDMPGESGRFKLVSSKNVVREAKVDDIAFLGDGVGLHLLVRERIEDKSGKLRLTPMRFQEAIETAGAREPAQRYRVDIRRVSTQGLPEFNTHSRYIMARSADEARRIVAAARDHVADSEEREESAAPRAEGKEKWIRQKEGLAYKAREIGDPVLDDPSYDEDMKAPSYSIRKNLRDMTKNEQDDALIITGLRAGQEMNNMPFGTRAQIFLAPYEPYPIALYSGVNDGKNEGFGRIHISAKAERFGGLLKMGQMLNKMLARGVIRDGQDGYRVKKYVDPNPLETPSKRDFRLYWTDPSTKREYVLGLERHDHPDGTTYAAIVTFFPVDTKETRLEERKASEKDVIEYQREQAKKRKERAPSYSIAPPVESPAFKRWFKDAAPQMKNPDGSPKRFYVGANPHKDFETFSMLHRSGATYASESGTFAGNWPDQEEVVDMWSPNGVRVYPVYAALKNPFDFRDPAHLQRAYDFIDSHPRYPAVDKESYKGLVSDGDWDIIEGDPFVGWLKDQKFDGLASLESPGTEISEENPVNWGIFRREDIKSVFNQDFDRADPRFSIGQPNNALLDFIRNNPDGFTVSVDGQHVPPSGFALAPVKGAEIVVPRGELGMTHVDALTDYIHRLQAISPQDVYAGGWFNADDQMYYLDASLVVDDVGSALYIANAADQIAIFDLGEFNEINTADGIAQLQEAGTYSREAHNVARRYQAKLAEEFGRTGDQSRSQQVGEGPHGDLIDAPKLSFSIGQGFTFGDQDGDAFFAGEAVEATLSSLTNPKSRETLVYMSPTEFLEMAEQGYRGDSDTLTFELLKSGKKFNRLPQLTFSHDNAGTAAVTDHDGRHRARNLRLLQKVELIPVLLTSDVGGGGGSIRWGEQLNPESHDYIVNRPVTLIGQGNNARHQMAMPESVIFPTGKARFSIAPAVLVERAQTALASGAFDLSEEEHAVSAISMLYNPDFQKMARQTVPEAARFLMNRARLPYGEYTPENVMRIARMMAAEALHAIQQDGNAAHWYRTKVESAHKILAAMFPEIQTNPYAKSALNFIMAVTSNGSTVSENAKNTVALYKEFRDYLPTGKYGNQYPYRMAVRGFGGETKAMEHAFDLWNRNVEQYGIADWMDFLKRDWRIGDLRAQGWDVGSELAHTIMPGSVIFGSKIGGGFFSNLEGNFKSLTMDLWFARMWGRMTGTLVIEQKQETKDKQRAAFRESLVGLRAADLRKLGVDVSEIVGRRQRMDNLPEDLLLPLADKFRRLDQRLGHPRIKDDGITPVIDRLADDQMQGPMNKRQANFIAQFRKQGIDPASMPQLERAFMAGKVLGNAQGAILKQPNNATHRQFMREATQGALDLLAHQGIDLELADKQALLWYPEKHLFDKLGTGDKRSAPTDYDVEMRVIARKEGLSDADIERAVQTGADGGGQGRDGADVYRRHREDGGLPTGAAEEVLTRYSIGQPRYAVNRLNQDAPGTPSQEAEFLRQFSERDKNIWHTAARIAKKQFRKQLAPGGLLHEIAFEYKIERDNKFRRDDNVMALRLASFRKAVKKGYKKGVHRLTPAEQEHIDDMLHGKTELSGDMPRGVAVAVAGMRQDIDNLSGRYADIIAKHVQELRGEAAGLRNSGNAQAAAQAEIAALKAEYLEGVILGNRGEYVNRSYRVFDDPTWFQRIPRDVQERAYRYLLQQYEGDHQATRTMFNKLTKGDGRAYRSMENLIKESVLGARDLTVLRKRNQIPVEIRELMGEYKDPQHNYARTMFKMTRMIWNTKFQQDLKDAQAGLGPEGRFLHEDGQQPGDATVQLANEHSDILYDLRGMWVTPETLEGLQDAVGKPHKDTPAFLQTLIGLNGITKVGKIIYSPGTQVRNFGSATFFGVMGGSMPSIADLKMAAKMIKEQILEHDGDTAAAQRDYIDIGLSHDSPNSALIRDLMEDGSTMLENIERFFDNPDLNTNVKGGAAKAKAIHRFMTNMYRGGDDFWKIVIFEAQLRDYMEATGQTRDQAKRTVAKRVRDTVPTYSLVGQGMRKWGRFPLMGPFVAFSSEVLRTNYNNIKLIRSDLQDPQLRGLARKRILGTVVAHSWAGAATALSAMAMGLDDDEEEAIRKLGLGPWAKNSDLLFLGRNADGQITYLDLSYIDPYNMFHKAFTALTRGLDPVEALAQAGGEMVGPFVSLDIATGALYDVISNTKRNSGAPIYNTDAPVSDIIKDSLAHLGTQMGPGVLLPVTKMYKAWDGQRDTSGREYDLELETYGLMGLKISTFDPKTSLNFRVFDFNEALGNSSRYLAKIAADINPVDQDALSDAFSTARDMRSEAYKDMLEIVNAAKKSGLSDHEVRQVLRSANVAKRYASALAKGQEEPPKWRIGKTFLKGATKRAKLLIDRETADMIRARRRTIREQARAAR